jgi:hypothetical protein
MEAHLLSELAIPASATQAPTVSGAGVPPALTNEGEAPIYAGKTPAPQTDMALSGTNGAPSTNRCASESTGLPLAAVAVVESDATVRPLVERLLGTTRIVPDAALDADPGTGVSVLRYADPGFGGPILTDVGGTSVAAPELAAMWALVLNACATSASCATAKGAKPYRLGNPDPLLYSIYRSSAKYATTFLPVYYGDNALQPYCSLNPGDSTNCPTPEPSGAPLDPGYSASPSGGYNRLTGLGVPFARSLIRAVVGI